MKRRRTTSQPQQQYPNQQHYIRVRRNDANRNTRQRRCTGRGCAPAGRLVSAVNCISIQQMANQEISARISLRAQLFLLDALHQVFGGTLCIAASLLLN